MKRLVVAIVAVLMLALAGQAQAQTITFNEMVPSTNAILGTISCGTTTGFQFSGNHFHLIGTAPGVFDGFSQNGTSHIGYESRRGLPIRMDRVGGGTFTFLSFDLDEFYTQFSSFNPDATTLEITGFLQGGGTVTHTVTLDGIYNNPYQHYTLPGTFTNLTGVLFTGHDATSQDGGIALDNIQYSVAGGPETLPACVATPLPTINPTVTITSPTAGQVAGTITLAANATAANTVAGVQFQVDGINVGAEDVTAPYSVQWNTTTVPDGNHTISAIARDPGNNIGTASFVVNVFNTPTGVYGPQYLNFDGIDDFVSSADVDDLSFVNGGGDIPFSMEMWLQPSSMAGRRQLVAKWQDTAEEYRFYMAAGYFVVNLRDRAAGGTASAYALMPASLSSGWHHVAVTYDGRGGNNAGAGITFYVDGVAQSATTEVVGTYVGMINGTAPLLIGHETTQWLQYQGGMDDLRLWNVARTGNQILGAMNAELTVPQTGLVAYWKFNEGVGIGAADATAAAHAATLQSGTAFVSGGPLAPDTTAPVVSNVATPTITSSAITVTFTTNEVTTGYVSYTTGAACPCTDVFDTNVGTTHSVTLTGLTSNTVYTLFARGRDAANNIGSAAAIQRQTLVFVPDSTPPTVTVTAPAAGTVAGTVTLSATANDNVGVVSVQFRVDGVNVGPALLTAPYTYAWDSNTIADGPHTITAQARDAANNVGTSASVAVTVANSVSAGPHYVSLDGVDDYLTTPDANDLSFGTGTADTPMTIEMWLQPGSIVGRRQLISKWQDGNEEFRLYMAAGYLVVNLRDRSTGGTASAFALMPPSLQTGWHHVAVSYDGRGGNTAGAGIAFYVDGLLQPALQEVIGTYVAMENTASPLLIGHETDQWLQYVGSLDDVRLWNVVRTPAQLLANMSSELLGSEAGLIAYWRFNAGTGTTVVDDSPQNHVLTLMAGTAWGVGGPLAPDVIAPTISNIATPTITSSSITVTFTTDEASTGFVGYTTGTACPCTNVFDAAVGTSHTVTLTGLTQNTTYRLFVNARDAANNLRTSAAIPVTTLVFVADSTPPTASLTAPAAGPVAGTVTLTATANDNVGVVSVQFKVDGVNVGTALLTAPYTRSWDTTTLADGPHTITVEARDAANNVGTSTAVVVTVSNSVSAGPYYVTLDGVDDFISVADANDLSFGNGTVDTPFTIETWLQPGSIAGRRQLIAKWQDGAEEYRLYMAAGYLVVNLRDRNTGGTATAYAPMPAGMASGWHHVAVSYDGRGGNGAGAGITFYVDGATQPASSEVVGAYVAMQNTTSQMLIGHESQQWLQYVGAMDDIRIWNIVRSPAQVLASMNTELGGSETGLIAYWRFNAGTGTAVNDDSPQAHTATLQSGTAYAAGGPLAPDVTAPVISGIATPTVTSSSITVTFSTDEVSTGFVGYTTGTACPCTNVFDAVVGTAHTVTLTGLTQNTTYRLFVNARDASNNLRTAAPLTVTTLVFVVDSTAPTAVVTAPAAGTVAGTVTLTATANDNVGVVSVQFRVDGVNVGSALLSAPYTFAWDSTTVTDGVHTITAQARDAANNVGTSAGIAVTVANSVSAGPHFVNLDGVDDFMSVADANDLTFGNGTTDTPFTIETWLQPGSVAGRRQLAAKWQDNAEEYRLYMAAGYLVVNLRDRTSGGTATAYSLMPANMSTGWHHVAVSYDGRGGNSAGAGLTFVVDGVTQPKTVETVGTYTAMSNTTSPLLFGHETQQWLQYLGGMDDIRVWNVVRSQAQVAASMGVELTGNEAGLIGYWRFNAGTGITVIDDSPQSHTLTLQSGTAWGIGGPLP